MIELAIRRALNENTRKEGVLVWNEIYALHITKNREAIVTDNKDYSKVYAVVSLDFYNLLSKQLTVMGEDFKEFVDKRIDDDEPEPFCPFHFTPMGYCDVAYSAHCYQCEESRGEWEDKKRAEKFAAMYGTKDAENG